MTSHCALCLFVFTFEMFDYLEIRCCFHDNFSILKQFSLLEIAKLVTDSLPVSVRRDRCVPNR